MGAAVKEVRIFYAGLLYGECSQSTLRRMKWDPAGKIYNGAYCYTTSDQKWWRMDGTPVLLSDVPKDLRYGRVQGKGEQ